MTYPHIDRCLGLHEDLTVIYVVDGYDAILHDERFDNIRIEGHGATVADALAALDRALVAWARGSRGWLVYAHPHH